MTRALSRSGRDLAIPGAKLSLSSHDRTLSGRDLTWSGCYRELSWPGRDQALSSRYRAVSGAKLSLSSCDLARSGCDIARSSRDLVLRNLALSQLQDLSLKELHFLLDQTVLLPRARWEQSRPAGICVDSLNMVCTDFRRNLWVRVSGLVVCRRFAIITYDVWIGRRPVLPSYFDQIG